MGYWCSGRDFVLERVQVTARPHGTGDAVLAFDGAARFLGPQPHGLVDGERYLAAGGVRAGALRAPSVNMTIGIAGLNG